jgi:uncharacterized protein YjbJ (UPF0337 family)
MQYKDQAEMEASFIQPKKQPGGHTMKSSTRDGAQGKWHKVKGKIKEIAGKVTMNPELEAEGKKESRAGEVQKKLGELKKFAGK